MAIGDADVSGRQRWTETSDVKNNKIFECFDIDKRRSCRTLLGLKLVTDLGGTTGEALFNFLFTTYCPLYVRPCSLIRLPISEGSAADTTRFGRMLSLTGVSSFLLIDRLPYLKPERLNVGAL